MCCDLQMLSVQVPGCAGMERLGAPGGPRLRHDHRHHHSTLEWEKQQRLQAMVGRIQEMVEQESRARSAAAAERLGLPPSIQLPDGEYGQDAHLQLRAPYQQDELTRSSVQPPPNKCVSDVPEWAGAADAPHHPSTISRLHSIIGTIRLAGVHARPGVL
ncbi:uncharacterized protein LOC113234153 isoform X3 [Hyposmocoma kahamanoa]|uniref:uncharacterized protein LOC113234153 isoform X3 n=1 Tax=Hyposmocoma kahamanoa TaxID=1477025 RepID=UPI000E6D7AE9|nr:uncharacterized protein LOC113234153 isoform X3 [Hyposmocoma kahamanoa]